ncbi:APC family permease [Yersinia hibernica]|uniref:APC family permease n=1 Tax=Yersinia enterocolitica LC20 TaxID=1443113 RepID=A0A7U4GH02_YEREN|nr:APC family permease [Yersinia hibernica]AHM75071.1 APC family permease [Yersinia hibernica]OVZ90831.1 Putrescine importer PuuP [Yersinia kristensenii]
MPQNIQLRRVLKTPALVAFGLAYMVPLGVFTTYGQVTVLSQGHLPIAYLVTVITILFTALSYCRMTNAMPLSGSAYSYVQRSFGGKTGFLVGWAQILDYLFLPILNYLVLGIFLHEAFPAIPAPVFIIASIISVSLLNILGVRLLTSVNFSLIAAQMIFIVLFIALSFSQADLSPAALMKPLLVNAGDMSGLLSGAAVLCLAFLGFDAIATMAEEAHDAKRTLPRAILFTVISAGTIFIAVSYAAHLAYPDWKSLIPYQDTASLIISEHVGGKWMYNFFMATYLTGVYASAMTAQTSVSRIFYAMGREGVLPRKIFFHLHRRFHTPWRAILFVATISLLALFLDLNLVVSMISFGALGAFTFVNLSVIKHFIFNEKRRGAAAMFKYGLLPLMGFVMSVWLWVHLEQRALEVGLLWLLAGFIYLLWLTRGWRQSPPSVHPDDISHLM